MKTCLDLRVGEEVSDVLSSQFMGEFYTTEWTSSWDSSVFLREETLHLWYFKIPLDILHNLSPDQKALQRKDSRP